MVDAVNHNTNCKVTLYELGDGSVLADSIANSRILINATSVGMAPNTDNCIIPDKSMLSKDLIVSDIIYNPMETKLIKMAKKQGCNTLTKRHFSFSIMFIINRFFDYFITKKFYSV